MFKVTAGSGFGSGAVAGRPEVTDAPDQSGILLHFRADIGITLNSGDVSSWEDQGTGGFDLTQGTAGRQPAFDATGGPNGTESVNFAGVTGGDGDMQNTGWSHANPVHYFAVFKFTGWNDGGPVFSGLASHTLIQEPTGGGTSDIHTSMTATPGALVAAGDNIPLLNTWILYSLYYNSSAQSMQLNDVTAQTSTATFGVAAKLSIACNVHGTGAKAPFNIAEFLAYDEQKTGGDLTAIKKYFNDQYAIF